MKKVKVFFDPRKEEEWLNSINGYALKRVIFIFYIFEKTNKKYNYSINYTPSKIDYLKLLNNLKSSSMEIKHGLGWTYISYSDKLFYRKKEEYIDNLKLFVKKYSLYSRSFLMFGFAFFTISLSINIFFIICSMIMFVLSFLYSRAIKTTKNILYGEK